MSDEALNRELTLLTKLASVCDVTGFENLEKYAKDQFERCVEKVFVENSPDPAVHLAQCEFVRGQGRVWQFLANMRSSVASEMARVRDQLAAKRKEA